jgi:hypothetical protein
VPPELLKAGAALFDECPVVGLVPNQQVHPGKQDRDVRAGLEGQPHVRHVGGRTQTRVQDDQAGAPLPGLDEFLHLAVMGVLSEMRAQKNHAPSVVEVQGFGRGEFLPERKLVTHVKKSLLPTEHGMYLQDPRKRIE